MSEPAKIARRTCLWAGIAFLVLGSALGPAYYLHYRPMWSPDVLGRAAQSLRDPSITVEALRSTALQGHNTLLASVGALDAAVLMLLIACAVAGVAFVYVFAVLRKGSQSAL